MVTGTVQVPTAAVPAHFEVSTDVASVRRGDSDFEPASHHDGRSNSSVTDHGHQASDSSCHSGGQYDWAAWGSGSSLPACHGLGLGLGLWGWVSVTAWASLSALWAASGGAARYNQLSRARNSKPFQCSAAADGHKGICSNCAATRSYNNFQVYARGSDRNRRWLGIRLSSELLVLLAL